ncbi:retrotransposon protein, putative, Ty1-copia subclass [Drepanopeziza brunnea f. sp. 'multigermtubi' MB_m1]|uniref:Retrotransposon protein, putative, Ty1-copia subclass n=1 Tax=Marssonina brunnea f. sp. multigermtubi (strain MB_m1) TaxID=1072389 RepID=K1XI11_MARBU|nr:retrotransposon protein, putative, Ty1-copia subclass [Drepanopeziza brunnea f. sp. 'multigermtubi' MB_m1]EKD12079.1 retrotransposon protein, putative, Ty1-copia subclass [Drepanopeziza brunnea f. sp. 'multigermtubi' MB_m1]
MSVYKNVTLLASMALISSKTDRNLDQRLIKLSDKNNSKVYKIKQGTDTYEFKSSSKYANKLLMLNKALYGLKQSARLWFITLKEVLIQKFSFTPLLVDSCILYNKELKLIISVYVDDLALINPNIDTIKSFIKELQKYFKLKDLRLIKDYLGIDIEYDIKRSYMKLSQESYITKILNRFDMLDCKPKPILMDSKAKLEPNPNKASASEITWFQQVIGCLLFLTLATRPDICYAVIKLARFASNPSESHIITQSTTEAEYMAINSAAKEAVYIKQLLTELGYYMQDKFPLYTDNNGALLLAKNPVFHERTKHIAVKYHYIKDLINKGIIDLVYIRTLNQKADGFIKALDKPKFNEFVKQLQLS